MTRRRNSAPRDEISRRALPVIAPPSMAFELLRDRALLEWAADPWLNPSWHQARITTRGRDGLSLSEAFTTRADIDQWAERADGLLRLDISTLRGRVPALKLIAIPKMRQWDPDYDENAKRDIVIPCILRRVLSSHLAYILTITSQGRLSKAAKAYVPGIIDPAPSFARRAAALMQKGHYYYAKVDIKDAFNTIPWTPLRRALRDMGYPQTFIEVVMAFVQAPTERRIRGRWLQQPRWRGALAGLPESAILLNILMREIDETLLHECNVDYERYSDDLFKEGMAANDVAGAVGTFLNWAWKVGFEIKGVPRRSDARRLVKDIRDQPMELLGIELDCQGDLHIPQRKARGHFAKLAFRERQAVSSPPLVVGRSKYATGAPPRGIVTTDQDDLDDLIWSTHRYWYPLNTAEAELFLSAASAQVSFGTYRRAYGPHRKLFVAELGPKSAYPLLRAGGGSGSPLQQPCEWIEREVLPSVEDILARDLEASEAACRQKGPSACGVTGNSQEEKQSRLPSPPMLGCCASGDDLAGSVPHSDRMIGSGCIHYSVASSAHQSDGFDRGASDGLDEEDELDIAPANPVDDPARTIGSSTGSLANAVFCFISSRSLGNDGIVIGFQEFAHDGIDVRRRAPAVRGPEEIEREVAYLRCIEQRRRAAVADGRPLIVLGSSWLSKQLLSVDRSFRRLGIFDIVTRVHREAERDGQMVLVIGPVRVPQSLSSALGGVVARSGGREPRARP